MIQSVTNYPISQLFDTESNVIYAVPKYQREYTWTRDEWEALFDDIVDNNAGYFLGSIICINQSRDALAVSPLEVVDGQQRLATLSLLFAALHTWLKEHEDELDEDQRTDLVNLKRNLVHKRNARQLRVVPQVQNYNLRDYEYILGLSGIIEKSDPAPWVTLRRIHRAYVYFCDRINTLGADEISDINEVLEFRDKLSSASIVKIEVVSHADAYVLFESLNNRGVPLTAVDLIKNKLLSRLERDEPNSTDKHFEDWLRLVTDLGDEYTVQERFFRQYYNAFRDQLRVDKNPIAKRSNLMKIYETLIDRNPRAFLDDVAAAGKEYAKFILRNGENGSPRLVHSYRSLERIQGAPSYTLLLHLLVRQPSLQLSDADLQYLCADLVRFFVRRNLTNMPPTYELDRLFMAIIDSLSGMTGSIIVSAICRQLAEATASDEEFRKSLEGPIYEENVAATRFILCSIAESHMTRETSVDLWRREGKIYAWSIEHIFPQGETIPDSWVQSIAGGDAALAKERQQQYVHTLGNLTITAYNSTLGNKSFLEKRDRVDREQRYVGYKNGLKLNQDLAICDDWSVKQIEARTQSLVDQALTLFRLQWK